MNAKIKATGEIKELSLAVFSGDGFIKKESMHTFKTYEEALEIGLYQALKLI